MLTISVIVPTKNRPALLGRIVEQLVAQTAPVAELIVVDQSDDDGGRRIVDAAVARVPETRRPHVRYVWDPRIDGAAAARNVGLDLARSDVVACVDDDMVPEPHVLERLLAHYEREPTLGAVSPVITNYVPPARRHRLFARLFYRGPFHDDRQPVYWSWDRERASSLVPVRILNGGLLTVRRAVLGPVRFDRRYRGASIGEDVDLSCSLTTRGARLAIAVDARVVHDRAPRPPIRHEEALLTSWGFVFDKHVPRTWRTRCLRGWFVAGVVLEAAVASLRQRTAAPLRSAAAGLWGLAHDYAGSPFLAPPSEPGDARARTTAVPPQPSRGEPSQEEHSPSPRVTRRPVRRWWRGGGARGARASRRA